MSEAKGEIVALIPAYNEVRYVADVVARALRFVPVVVIDDGSTDGTAAAAALAGAKVISHTSNQGKGRALNSGFDYAVRRGVDAAITLDADGQHDPDEIPKFIEAYRAGEGDLIIGQRTFAEMPAERQLANRVGGRLLAWAMGQSIPDNQSGYRLLSGEVMRVARPSSARFDAEVEILLRAQLAGFRISAVPIKTIYHEKKSHFHPVHDSLRFLGMVWRIWRARVRGRFE